MTCGYGSASNDKEEKLELQMTNQVVFITGGSKGIGRATARLLAEEGCRVVITARESGRLERVAAELREQTGAEVIGLAGDMSVAVDVERTVAETLERLGADRRPGHLRRELSGRAARGSHRGAVAGEPEPEVHGLRQGLLDSPAPHAAPGLGQRRPRGWKRRLETEAIGR